MTPVTCQLRETRERRKKEKKWYLSFCQIESQINQYMNDREEYEITLEEQQVDCEDLLDSSLWTLRNKNIT